jgi:DNA (cytosine-5)-methyltransferase 1
VFGSEAKCIGYSEIDKYAIEVYRRRYPTHPALGDVQDIRTDTLGDFDILFGGFPCPSFSICGKGGGLNDPRGKLFFEIVRILKDKAPRYFLLENVRGLLSHEGGDTFTKVIETLTDLGYVCQSELLDSKFCGVPQNRQRVFIFGVRDGGRPKIFPFKYKETGTDTRPQAVSSALDANYWKGTSNGYGGKWRQLILSNVYGGFKETKPRVHEHYSPTIRTPSGGGHLPVVAILSNEEKGVKGIQEQTPEETEKGNNVRQDNTNEDSVVALTERRTEEAKKIRRETKDRDFCPRRGKELTARKDHAVGTITTGITNEQLLYDLRKQDIRNLTPVECERLQGYPDGWTEGLSDTRRYCALGNSVTTNVITQIMTKFKEVHYDR